MKMTVTERIQGFACEVVEGDFEEFKKAARFANLPVYDADDYDPSYPFYAWDGSDLCGYYSVDSFMLIPMSEYIAKLKGESISLTKAEVLARFNITITD
jgi:hypothetical protein